MMENGCISNICFLSFKELFHFQEVQLPPWGDDFNCQLVALELQIPETNTTPPF